MKRPVFIVLISAGALLTLVLSLLVSSYLLISSESFISSQIPKVQESLKEAGIHSRFERIKISPMDGLLLENFHLESEKDPHVKFKVTGKKLSAVYNLRSLFLSQLEVEHIILDELTLEIKLKDLPPGEKPEESPPVDLNKVLEDLLENPPIDINIKKIALNQLTVKVQLEDSNTDLNLKLTDINLLTSASMEKRKLLTKFQFAFGEDPQNPSHLNLTLKGEKATKVSSDVQFTVAGDLKVEKNQQWQLNLDDQNLKLLLARVNLDLGDTQKISLDNFTFEHKLNVTGTGNQDNQKFLEKFLPMQGSSRLNTSLNNVRVHVTGPEGKQTIRLSPKFSSLIEVQKGQNPQSISDLQLEGSQDLKIKSVEISQHPKGKTALKQAINGIRTQIHSRSKRQTIKINVDNTIAKMSLHPQKKSVKAHFKSSLSSDFSLKDISIRTDASLNQWKLLSLENKLSNRSKTLASKGTIKIDIPMDLATLHPALKILYQLGSQDLTISNDLELKHQEDSAIHLDAKKLEGSQVLSKIELKLKQSEAPRSPKDFIAKYPNGIELNIDSSFENKNAKNQIKLTTNQLRLRDFAQPLDIMFSSDDSLNLSERQLDLSGKSSINGHNLLDYDVKGKDREGLLDANAKIKLESGLKLYKLMASLEPLRQIGHLFVDTHIDLSLKHMKKTILEFNDKDIAESEAKINVKTKIFQDEIQSKNKDLLLSLGKSVQLEQDISSQGEVFTLESSVNAPEIQVKNLAKLDSLRNRIKVTNNEKDTRKDFDITLDTKLAKINVLKEGLPEISQLLRDLHITGDLRVRDLKKIYLDNLALNMDQKSVRSQSYATALSESQEVQTEGFFSVKLPEMISRTPNITGSGSVHLPWNLVVDRNKEILLDSQSTFNRLSIKGDNFDLDRLHGKIRIREKLQLLDDKTVKFAYYKESNPFNRVDYNLMEPYLANDLPFSIQNIRFKDWSLGPLQAKVEIEQNVLSIPRFNLALFDGNLAGKFFLDFNPNNIRIGLLSRLSKLNPSLMVTSGRASLKEDAEASISARTNFVFNLSKALVEGKVDITEIGSEQLVGLIDIIDPDYEDDKLVQLRQLLGLGYPTRVTIKMNRGTMDLSVDLVITGIRKTQDIYGIPLTPIIQSKLGDIQKTLKSIPIK